MKIEPKINTQKLKLTNLEEYGFKIEKIKFIPKSDVGLSFVAQRKEIYLKYNQRINSSKI
ncbi:hypothetical protein LCGC14_1300320 [marine sediment metagenome]|uniref:Uncharacterized protein n=1 Tax=marine sediment metagenome TaxID=412755 RepID=A0A0F9N6G9_9ZZZZ|nr:hypothetical protein [bacterium]